MDSYSLPTVARMLAAMTTAAGLAGCMGFGQAQAQAQADAPPSVQAPPAVVQADPGRDAPPVDATPVAPPPQAEPVIRAPEPQGPTAELQRLIQDREVTELRTTYNGTFGASLLFKQDDLLYYVAMFRQKDFWRVYRTSSEAAAEQTYQRFVARTAELAEVDIRRIRLEAQQAHTERLLSERAGQLTALQSELGRQREQSEQIVASQRQARQEAAELAEQQKKARAELQRVQAQIRALERQQAAVGGGAPARSAK